MLTVLMSMFNSAAYLELAIRSTLAQSYKNFEFLIVDDGSTDNSLEIAKRYQKHHKRIRIIAHENWGACDSLNDAAKRARGDWLFRMDPDDMMLPTRLERQVTFLRDNPDLSVASSLAFLIDSNGRMIGRSRSPYTSRKVVLDTIAGRQLIGFHHPAAAMKKSAFLSLGGYRKQYWLAEDLDLWNRFADQGHMLLVQPEYLIKYRVHSQSVSIASGRRQVQIIDWVEDSKNRRHTNLPELTFEQFLAEREKQPTAARLNERRKTYARTLYKAAVQHWSMRRYHQFFPELAAALVLEPDLVLPRVWPRLAS
jgi:glycosyltransferase involved in cell wall biosynthesis